MKDIFKNYHKHKVLQHAGILAFSLVMALGINMFILSGDTGGMLKANVLEATQTETSLSDIYSKIDTSSVSLHASTSMQEVKELSLSLVHDPEIEIGDIITLEGISQEAISNTPGITTLIMKSETPINIEKDASIVKLSFKKTLETGSNIINIVSANFIDSRDDTYNLSVENIIF